MPKAKNIEKGFTLVEVLITIFIIALLSGIIFANYPQGNRQFLLQRTATKLAQDIRRVQQMAMSAATCSSICPLSLCGGACGATVPPGGYGIYFNSLSTGSYLLYADNNNDKKYTSGSDTNLETINFENGINIINLTSDLSINFQPPDPIVDIVGSINPQEADISLGLGTIIRTVKCNKGGLIWVE